MYDPARLSIVDVRTVGLGSSMQLVSNDLGGSLRIAMYGTQPLEGSGSILAITVEAHGTLGWRLPVQVTGQANEGAIPLKPVSIPRVVR